MSDWDKFRKGGGGGDTKPPESNVVSIAGKVADKEEKATRKIDIEGRMASQKEEEKAREIENKSLGMRVTCLNAAQGFIVETQLVQAKQLSAADLCEFTLMLAEAFRAYITEPLREKLT